MQSCERVYPKYRVHKNFETKVKRDAEAKAHATDSITFSLQRFIEHAIDFLNLVLCTIGKRGVFL